MSVKPFMELVIGDKYILRLWLASTKENCEPVYELRMTPKEVEFHQGMLDDCFPREPGKM